MNSRSAPGEHNDHRHRDHQIGKYIQYLAKILAAIVFIRLIGILKLLKASGTVAYETIRCDQDKGEHRQDIGIFSSKCTEILHRLLSGSKARADLVRGKCS